jgi:hypothetical protein
VALLLEDQIARASSKGELGASSLIDQLKILGEKYLHPYESHIEWLMSAITKTPKQLNLITELDMYVRVHFMLKYSLTSMKGLNASSSELRRCLMPIY